MIRLAEYQLSGTREAGNKITRYWYVDTEDEIFECIAANLSYRGYSATGEITANTRVPETIEAGFEVGITFGSIEGQGPDQGDEYGGDVAKWDFEPTFQQTAIEKNPDINELIANYGGEEDPQTHRVTFRRFLTELPRDDKRGALGSSNRDASGQIKNPLYGFNESGYITMGGIATARYITSNISTAMNAVGRVFKRLPGNAPDYGLEDDRDFIKMPPRISEVAREETGQRWYDLTHQFMMSDKGGWPPAVYKFIEI
jgi:hypothetical protein